VTDLLLGQIYAILRLYIKNKKQEVIMEKLDLNVFLAAGSDLETSQYKILALLKRCETSMAALKLYPFLSDLILLSQQLEELLKRMKIVKSSLRKEITGFNLQAMSISYAVPSLSGSEIEHVFSLMDWALPKIQESIAYGARICDPIWDNISIEGIGVLPVNVLEGFTVFPLLSQKELHVHSYTIFKHKQKDDIFWKLRVKQEGKVMGDFSPNTDIKSELTKKYFLRENLAVYKITSDFDLPFEETLFPLAKRKFLDHVLKVA
jgi:hypothetical protein